MAVEHTPVFLLQIVDALPPHDVVRLRAGGVLERDLTEIITAQILAKGIREALIQDVADTLVANVLKRRVGFWRSEEHVTKSIVAGVQESFDRFPSHDGEVHRLVYSAIADAIMSLKQESVKAVS